MLEGGQHNLDQEESGVWGQEIVCHRGGTGDIKAGLFLGLSEGAAAPSRLGPWALMPASDYGSSPLLPCPGQADTVIFQELIPLKVRLRVRSNCHWLIPTELRAAPARTLGPALGKHRSSLASEAEPQGFSRARQRRVRTLEDVLTPHLPDCPQKSSFRKMTTGTM